MQVEIAIVGAGLAGLACARELRRRGFNPHLFEASDGVGGRVRTDLVDGFQLDRGFQVLLTAYPECRRVLNYPALDLHEFIPGAKVHTEGAFHAVADPHRRPQDLLRTLNAPVGSIADKWRILALRRRVQQGSLSELFGRDESTAEAALQELGFSRQMIDRFFRPWLGGIFLGRDLQTSSRFFDFVMRMMTKGETALPAEGMGAIAAQLSSGLDEQTLHLREPVERLADGALELASGEAVQAEQIILATEGPAAARLLGNERLDPGSRRVSCLYFAAEVPPTGGAWLYLDGEGNGPINNLCAPSEVAPGYAPPGESLISVSVLGDPSKTLEEDVRRQAKRWFGSSVDTWRHLRTYHIDHAQPQQLAGFMEERRGPLEDQGILVCGDWRETASLHGAMYSGRQAAAAVARRSKAGS